MVFTGQTQRHHQEFPHSNTDFEKPELQISHQVITDFSCNTGSLLSKETSSIGDGAIGKAACSRVGYKLDPSFLPSHQHWPCCWGSGKSLYWINILWWIQPWLLLCLGEILEALFWRSVLRRREKSFWPPLTRWPTPVEKYSFHTVLIGSIGRI